MKKPPPTGRAGRTPQIDLTKQSADEEREREVRYYMRHVVPIYFHIRKGSDERQFVHTSFAFSVAGCWALITEGHCIAEVERVRAAGYELIKCRILDALGVNAKYTEPVPFDYEGATPMHICRDEAWDYGVMFPSDNTYARETDAPMFYGELLDNPLSSLKGMSGGPILSFKDNCGDGTGRYWLHAMQVSQMGGSKQISGIRMAQLGDFMREVAEGKHRDLATDAPNDAAGS
jgi:hypothetical protein